MNYRQRRQKQNLKARRANRAARRGLMKRMCIPISRPVDYQGLAEKCITVTPL